jgi:hypothetical protein
VVVVSASWIFHNCVPVENDNICCDCDFSAPEDEDDEVLCCCCKLISSRRISDFLLPRNSWAHGREDVGDNGCIAIRGVTFSGCLRGSSSDVIPVDLFTNESFPVCSNIHTHEDEEENNMTHIRSL